MGRYKIIQSQSLFSWKHILIGGVLAGVSLLIVHSFVPNRIASSLAFNELKTFDTTAIDPHQPALNITPSVPTLTELPVRKNFHLKPSRTPTATPTILTPNTPTPTTTQPLPTATQTLTIAVPTEIPQTPTPIITKEFDPLPTVIPITLIPLPTIIGIPCGCPCPPCIDPVSAESLKTSICVCPQYQTDSIGSTIRCLDQTVVYPCAL
ncbi:hypothetical protein HGA91_03740 [candidate division WWE3 bacterium]|nr:hypothetical protein [candidate division WWE3 bacterium]